MEKKHAPQSPNAHEPRVARKTAPGSPN